jgi:hypothetical protein
LSGAGGVLQEEQNINPTAKETKAATRDTLGFLLRLRS